MESNIAGAPGLDPTLPDITVNLFGEELPLVLSLNAIVQLQKKIGKNPLVDGVNLADAGELRAALWAGLLRAKPDVTEEAVGDEITARNWVSIAKKVSDALTGSQAEADPNAPAGAPADPPSA